MDNDYAKNVDATRSVESASSQLTSGEHMFRALFFLTSSLMLMLSACLPAHALIVPNTAIGISGSPTPPPGCAAPPNGYWKIVAYPVGWNLIGGSSNSCVIGAIEPAYTVPVLTTVPSASLVDNVYLPSDLPNLPFGSAGSWVYFPHGGQLELAMTVSVSGCAFDQDGHVSSETTDQTTGRTCILIQAQPGRWRLVGNPSPYGPATFSRGVDKALLYVPGKGYTSTTSIPVGQAAWVLPSTVQALQWNPLSGTQMTNIVLYFPEAP